MTDDPSGRLIALRDQFLAEADAANAVKAATARREYHEGSSEELRVTHWVAAERARCAREHADALDGLITALLRPQREENKEDDPRNRASVLRSETEPTR